jgi:hypothetical protein
MLIGAVRQPPLQIIVSLPLQNNQRVQTSCTPYIYPALAISSVVLRFG